MADSQSNNKDLHLLYKNLGETPHEAILRYKKDYPDHTDLTMTYAGRLDPMAEGVLLVLSGDLVFEKDKYLDLPKTYEFEILWGFETDTLDMLGVVSENSFESTNFPTPDLLTEYLNTAIGKFEQIYPVYSSRPVNGKSLFQWAREGRISEIDIPKHEVELYEAEYLSRRTISKVELLKDIEHKVGLVQGDFRQKEILERWQEALKEIKSEEFVIDKVKVVVSSGFYIRQFVHDISENFGAKAVTFHIKRTKIGDYC